MSCGPFLIGPIRIETIENEPIKMIFIVWNVKLCVFHVDFVFDFEESIIIF